MDETLVDLWDPRTGHHQATFAGHLDSVHCLAFSNDGKLLASGSADFAVRVWDVETGRPAGELVGHAGAITGLSFKPGAGAVLASSSKDRSVRLWNARTLSHMVPLRAEGGLPVTSCSWSRGGGLIAAGEAADPYGADPNVACIRLWDSVQHVQVGEVVVCGCAVSGAGGRFGLLFGVGGQYEKPFFSVACDSGQRNLQQQRHDQGNLMEQSRYFGELVLSLN